MCGAAGNNNNLVVTQIANTDSMPLYGTTLPSRQ